MGGSLEAVIFDMDGVIIDSEPLHFQVDLDVLNGLNVRLVQHDLEPYVGMTNPEMWKLLKERHGLTESIDELIGIQLGQKLATLEISDYEPIDGIPELLAALGEAKIKLALGSSSPIRFIDAVLDKFGIAASFTHRISGEEMERGKPAPDIFLNAAELLNVSPAGCVVIEDSLNGVAAAKAAGMSCIGYRNVNSGQQDLSKADIVVDSIRDITVELLEQIVGRSSR